jgi:hypothetical protein
MHAHRGCTGNPSVALLAAVGSGDQEGCNRITGRSGPCPPGAGFFAAAVALGMQAEKVHAVSVACFGRNPNHFDRRSEGRAAFVIFQECQVVACILTP